MKNSYKVHLLVICFLSAIISLIASLNVDNEIQQEMINTFNEFEDSQKIIKLSYWIGIILGTLFSFFQPVLVLGFLTLLLWLFIMVNNSSLKFRSLFQNGIKPYYVILIGQVITFWIILPFDLKMVIQYNIHSITYTFFFLLGWWRNCHKSYEQLKKNINFAFIGTVGMIILFTSISYSII
ncbi:hypothetical protein EDD68_11817 [Melghiribacillus thermohalophilus]|uniref:Yip1 domain-containing protein n=1 Tax=Melghiribacillus thermohalophilus TaxID=1324956 RepID=A0A4R3MSS0_9BACI|nr:hypothetical protein [Melghiribacillus thermohalophilus]TCT19334.1 hypothetical protein EDD68_11817 [Melghiribacillus thermohalophilus]